MNVLRELITFAKVAHITAKLEEGTPASFRTPMMIRDTLDTKYGADWLLFLPETIRISIEKDFSFKPSEVLLNKVFATQAVLNNPYFEWDIFENIVNAFNDNVPDFTIMEPPSPMELVYGFQCLKGLQPEYKIPEDVESYCKTIMFQGGLMWLPWLGLEIGDNPQLITSIKEVWKSVDKTTQDMTVNIQIDRLSIIQEYLKQWLPM